MGVFSGAGRFGRGGGLAIDCSLAVGDWAGVLGGWRG